MINIADEYWKETADRHGFEYADGETGKQEGKRKTFLLWASQLEGVSWQNRVSDIVRQTYNKRKSHNVTWQHIISFHGVLFGYAEG